MTEFEQQVANALSAAWAREDGPPFAMDGVWQWLAPRVAAAIEADNDYWCLERPPEGGWYVQHGPERFGPFDLNGAIAKRVDLVRQSRREAALAALRGKA